MDAPLDRVGSRRLPGFADPVALELGEDQQDAQERLAHRRRKIQVVSHAHQHRVVALELLQGAQRSHQRARETVQLGDDHTIGLAAANPLEDRIEDRPAHRPAADVKLGLMPGHLGIVELRPGLDSLPLNGGGDEAVARPARYL